MSDYSFDIGSFHGCVEKLLVNSFAYYQSQRILQTLATNLLYDSEQTFKQGALQ
jgi:hypothetical protein